MLIIEVNNSGSSCRLREFGKKIKRLRLAKKISRSEFCGDESELSIRQLIRIENGESRPILTKLKYIAERLGCSSCTPDMMRFIIFKPFCPASSKVMF